MPEFTPTASQRLAIETRGRNVLVSAAAGSGKTKVLTERLLARISDEKDPADIDSFLIITFTKAAAAELRGRISDEIAARLAQDPQNMRLRRQSALMRRAQIGTIHSFCSAVLREYCHAAAISPDFRVIEDDRAASMRERVLDRLMEAKYRSIDADADFKMLVDTVGQGRDDARLVSLVLTLHAKIQSHARPELWAREQIKQLELEGISDAAETPWGREILDSLKDSAHYWAGRMRSLALDAQSHEKIYAAYGSSLECTAQSLDDFSRALDESWDKARDCLPIEYPKLGVLRSSPDPELSGYIKSVRDLCKAETKKYSDRLLGGSEKLLGDMKLTVPAMRALLELTLDFDRAYLTEKRRRAELDFSDLEHMTARLLTDEDGSPSDVARELSRRYTEIMVDEYQDVSRVQDMIFHAVSNGHNLFMVGDVKQSIYRFRLADPGIFTEKYLSYADCDKASEGEAGRIMLSENFRSRRQVIDAVNHVFSCCMSVKLGELEYDDNARLKVGASYDGSAPTPELCIVEYSPDEDENADKTELEASFAAQYIRRLIDEKAPVTDHGVTRPARWSDVAIIIRSANSVGDVYRRELSRLGIPVGAGQGGGFFESLEISTLMSLLAVIDNPHQDVPLIAVLTSPIFGFSADELSHIRSADRRSDFYTALTANADKNEKCAAFVEKLEYLRSLAPDMTLGEFIWRVYDELDIMAIYSAMRDGNVRRENLSLMSDYAQRFEDSGSRGLHRFCAWLLRLSERGEEPGRAVSGNSVSIMTVHKSKGLEFPIVFLCDTNRRFNRSDSRATVLVHPELGLGPKVTDIKRGIEYPSLARSAVALRAERELLSEEMRLLYVALTRAKEYLVITANMRKVQEKVDKMSLSARFPMPAQELLSAQSPASWLLAACLADREGHLRLRICSPEQETVQEQETASAEPEQADEALLSELRRRLSFEYPHAAAQSLPSKVTATELKRYEEQDAEAQSIAPSAHRSFRRPELGAGEKPLTAAERGTATHMLLQFMDYSLADTREGIENELRRLEKGKFLSARQAEAVNTEAVLRLFTSELGQRIKSADKLHRELRFSLLCPADSVFPNGAGEQLLLQGVIDCCIEENGRLVIIDYKTDRVSGAALHERAERYAGQLKAYALAAERMLGLPVKECMLYFLHTGETVRVETERSETP